jgi:hypothetical protein
MPVGDIGGSPRSHQVGSQKAAGGPVRWVDIADEIASRVGGRLERWDTSRYVVRVAVVDPVRNMLTRVSSQASQWR